MKKKDLNKKIAVVSGGFDPIHSGHINYINSAKNIGDMVIVALNSDQWLINKKGKFFMPFKERKVILENLTNVDMVIGFKDDIHGSCKNALEDIKTKYPEDIIIFCNGGDRTFKNIPEKEVKDIEFRYEIGGNIKQNSSSSILKEFHNNSEERLWGKFYTYMSEKNLKLKELIVYPKKGMSFQRHLYRNEVWFVSKGECIVRHSLDNTEEYIETKLTKDQIFKVSKNQWHQIINPNKDSCHIIEIQYGNLTNEDDIERHSYYEGEIS